MFEVTEKTEVDEVAKEAFEVLFKQINKMGNEASVEKALQEVLNVEHRTLQQNFMRSVVCGAVRHFAKKKEMGCFDLRNEATVEAAAKMLPHIELGFPFV
jgi:hypothetical protein